MLKTVVSTSSVILEKYSQFTFKAAEEFYWSAGDNTIFYQEDLLATENGTYRLIHEVGHALLGHRTFRSGVGLVSLETAAWTKALEVAQELSISIPTSYIESCLDSYRDWLHLRSLCPDCKNISVESDENEYHCFNCMQKWTVSPDQRLRSYRRKLR